MTRPPHVRRLQWGQVMKRALLVLRWAALVVPVTAAGVIVGAFFAAAVGR